MRVCSACGKENADDARFCSACGAALPAEAAIAREVRKTVTIVFCDVTGSTTLGERLDPESLRRVMSRYFEEMRTALERHGGTVEKFIGDAVMAVFGVPVLHEDDALRAVRATVEMREALAALNEELERAWAVRVAARTGVNTGEVVAGDAASGQAFATGDTVNVAARLEQAAQPGEILIGEDTYRLVRDAVLVEPVEPLALKGKGQPVAVFRLLEVTPGAPAFARRLDSPMVGRESERMLLAQAYERVVRERGCHLFTILGSAGVGKSRLVAEFQREVGDEARLISGRCLPYGEGITFWPLAEALQNVDLAAALREEADRDLIHQRVEQALGVSDSTAGAEEIFWAVRKLLEALARERPLLAVFEDVHWAEPTFLDLVEHLADLSRDAPILLLCLARPELLDHRSGWGGGKLNATSILLEPLTAAECDRLIENLLGRARLAEEARSRIAEAAEGNPLFVEEMLAMLIDDGLLRRRNGSWEPSGDLSTVSVPPTIQALLAARLDRLQGAERAVIERAAVEGKVFHRGAVQELSPEAARRELGAHLTTLVRKELIRPAPAAFAGEEAFRFRHMLLRDAAYESLPKQARAELHERFAAWLERAAGERVMEYEEILGYHLEQAFRCRAELGPPDDRGRELAARAAERLASAGRRALARRDMSATVNLLERAVFLLPADEPARAALLPDLSIAFRERGDFARAETVLAEAVELASAAGDRRLEAHASIERLLLRLQTDPEGRSDEARREAERLIPVLEELGDELGLAKSWHLVGFAHWMNAAGAATTEAMERAAEHAKRAGNRAVEADCLRWLPVAAQFGPMPVAEAILLCEAVVERAQGQREVEATALIQRGLLHGMQGEFERARELCASGRAMLEDLGLKVWAAAASQLPGLVELLAGDPVAAEGVLRSGYDVLERLGEKSYLSTSAAWRARALFAQGRYEEAGRFTEISEQAGASDDLLTQTEWRAVRALVLARRGRLAEAEALAREAVALSERTDFLAMRGDALLGLAEVLRLGGRSEAAAEAVEEAAKLYEQKGNVVSAGRARALLAELGR